MKRELTYVEVARVQVRSVLVVGVVEISERDVVDIAVAHVRTGPGLESPAKLAVDDPYVFDENILNVVKLARIFTNGAHGLAVRACETVLISRTFIKE